MRIDPKPFTFDAIERATLVAALATHGAALKRNREKLYGRDEKSRAAIERNEITAARVADLISALTA